MTQRRTARNGFARTGQLMTGQVRRASEARGFEKSQLLTHWEEIVGPDTAAICHPSQIKFGRQGIGATLTLLTSGPHAPMLEMQKEDIRTKVNAVYGYTAISYVRITQTSPHGFAEGQMLFQQRKPAPVPAGPTQDDITTAQATTSGVGDNALRDALTKLGGRIIEKQRKGTQA